MLMDNKGFFNILINEKDVYSYYNDKLNLKLYRQYRKFLKFKYDEYNNKKDFSLYSYLNKYYYSDNKILSFISNKLSDFYLTLNEHFKLFITILRYRKFFLNINKGYDYSYFVEAVNFKINAFVKFYEGGYWNSLGSYKFAFVCKIIELASKRLMNDDYENDLRLINYNSKHKMTIDEKYSFMYELKKEDLSIITSNIDKYLFKIWD